MVQAALEKLITELHSTVVLIAHRLSTVINATQICVVHKARFMNFFELKHQVLAPSTSFLQGDPNKQKQATKKGSLSWLPFSSKATLLLVLLEVWEGQEPTKNRMSCPKRFLKIACLLWVAKRVRQSPSPPVL